MKKHPRLLRLLASALALAGLTATAHAAVTGQWDFKNGDLSATIGQPLQDLNAAGATVFGTSSIGGTPTNVMKFPKAPNELGGYLEVVGAAANGGGGLVNQYSVVMDVLFPAASAGKNRALFLTDSFGPGEVSVTSGDALAVSGGPSGGTLTP